MRKRARYLSKGNYHLGRLEYLASLFPDARFLVPVRHPASHVDSLVRQHQRFVGYAADDPRVAAWLAAGHYEFGPQRVPTGYGPGDSHPIETAWNLGDEHQGYAIQWASAYRFVETLLRQDPWSQRLVVVRYEDLCADPPGTFSRLLPATGIDPESALATERLDHITRSTAAQGRLDRRTREVIWRETGEVARRFGYDEAGD